MLKMAHFLGLVGGGECMPGVAGWPHRTHAIATANRWKNPQHNTNNNVGKSRGNNSFLEK